MKYKEDIYVVTDYIDLRTFRTKKQSQEINDIDRTNNLKEDKSFGRSSKGTYLNKLRILNVASNRKWD